MEIKPDFKAIVQAYFPRESTFKVQALGDGNINDTYRIDLSKGAFLLQKINRVIFKEPEVVLNNHQLILQHLKKHSSGLLLPKLIQTDKQLLAYPDANGGCWRMLTFLEHTYGVESANSVDQVAAAAGAIGRFIAALNQAPAPKLGATLPDFHHFQKRYAAFLQILKTANPDRRTEAAESIEFLLHWAQSIPDYKALNLPQRLVHNDPKIGNVLFNQKDQAVAVIDWDTVMPGTLPTDFGDMVRTMVASVSEDEADLDLVNVNKDYFSALCQHFLKPLKPLLRPLEKQYLMSGAFYIVLEQMLRFLQDYLLEDVYYKIQYPKHNLVRARNQQALFQALKNQEQQLEVLIAEAL
ncbi:MAG: aminoglycoside phosphotransferase family protein [Saprospiraceae bacterium]